MSRPCLTFKQRHQNSLRPEVMRVKRVECIPEVVLQLKNGFDSNQFVGRQGSYEPILLHILETI